MTTETVVFTRDLSWPDWLGKPLPSTWVRRYGSSLGSAFIDVLHHYGHKQLLRETIPQKSEIEETLSEVHRNREILAALMQHDWLGLKILAHLRTSGRMRLSDLTSVTRADANHAAAVIAQLVLGGAVIVEEEEFFVCAELGASILENLERNAAVDLNTAA